MNNWINEAIKIYHEGVPFEDGGLLIKARLKDSNEVVGMVQIPYECQGCLNSEGLSMDSKIWTIHFIEVSEEFRRKKNASSMIAYCEETFNVKINSPSSIHLLPDGKALSDFLTKGVK